MLMPRIVKGMHCTSLSQVFFGELSYKLKLLIRKRKALGPIAREKEADSFVDQPATDGIDGAGDDASSLHANRGVPRQQQSLCSGFILYRLGLFMMLRGGGGGWRRGSGERAHDSDVNAYGRGRGGKSGDGRKGEGRGGGDAVVWTEEDDERLRKSIKENRVDDWQTLGDWSEVAAAVGGGKTAEECFNRWQAISVGKTGYYGNSVTSAHMQNFPHGLQAPPGGAYSGHHMVPSHPPETVEGKYPAPFGDPSFQPAHRYPAHIPPDGAFSGYNPQPSYPGPFDGRSVGPAIEPEVRPEPTLGLYPLPSSIGGAHRHGARADEGGGSASGDHGHYALHGQPMWFPYQHPGPEGDGPR